mgnify:CR=1 FL=1
METMSKAAHTGTTQCPFVCVVGGVIYREAPFCASTCRDTIPECRCFPDLMHIPAPYSDGADLPQKVPQHQGAVVLLIMGGIEKKDRLRLGIFE